MEFATAIRGWLGQILAHQTEQVEAIDLGLAERSVTPVSHALHHLGHNAGQRGGQRRPLQGVQATGDHGVCFLLGISERHLFQPMKKDL